MSKEKQNTAGSSPRVRGTAGQYLTVPGAGRFIPACAGNSLATGSGPYRKPVHPRVCGEQAVVVARFNIQNGSSPRVRGTDCLEPRAAPLYRFIPACAGNSEPTA